MARANQLELVVAIAVASTSSEIALFPLKSSFRTTRWGSCAVTAAGAVARSANAKRRRGRSPHWSSKAARRGVEGGGPAIDDMM